MEGLKNVVLEIWVVFKENFVYLNGICQSEEMVRE